MNVSTAFLPVLAARIDNSHSHRAETFCGCHGCQANRKKKRGKITVKLSKDTKHLLRQGVSLSFGGEDVYTVETVLVGTDRYRNPTSVSITVRDKYGRAIYLAPCSAFYGAEIING